MTASDPIMARIDAGIACFHRGDHAEARERLTAVWEEIGPVGDPFHRCTLAHFMADLQADPHAELMWDLRALDAAEALTDARVKQHHATLALDSFYPSLHLNLAEDYRKLGNQDLASKHLERAKKAVAHLPDEGFANFLRMGIARLDEQLTER